MKITAEVFFIRQTHDKVFGHYKFPDGVYCPHQKGLGVHAWNGNEQRLTFDQFINAHYDYKRSFPDYRVPSAIILLKELLELVRTNLVRVEVDVDGQPINQYSQFEAEELS